MMFPRFPPIRRPRNAKDVPRDASERHVDERFLTSHPMDILQTYEAYADYALAIRNHSPVTVNCRRGVIRFFASETGIRDLADVSPDAAREFLLQGRSRRNWSSSTYWTYHKHLNVFFDWCVRQGHVAENPFAGLEKPKLEQKLPRRLSCGQAERLLDACRTMRFRDGFQRSRCLALVALLLYTGLRRSEALNLKMTDVNLDEGILQVIHGKGGKDRFLPLNARLIPILAAYLKERAKRQPDIPNFFVSRERGKAFGERGLRRLFDRLKARTGLDFSPHALRHTFATLMLEGGCNIYPLSRMLGHSKITTTTIYLAASTGLLARSMEKHPLGCP